MHASSTTLLLPLKAHKRLTTDPWIGDRTAGHPAATASGHGDLATAPQPWRRLSWLCSLTATVISRATTGTPASYSAAATGTAWAVDWVASAGKTSTDDSS